MISFLSLFVFFMAFILPSRRSTCNKASAESQLKQHLPMSAQTLLSPLSEGDLEVLRYMVAFGLHLQMPAELVVSSSNPKWKLWKAPSVKVDLKNKDSFVPLSSQSVPWKSQSGLQQTTPLLAHKLSARCDCFSCYSSFWSRWAASPNRDLLNTIIDIAEMAYIGEEQKACKGKEKRKKQEKKRIVVQETGGKKAKRKLQSTSNPPLTSSVAVNMDDTVTAAGVLNEISGCSSTDAMYDALWDSVCVSKDETPHLVSQIREGPAMLAEKSRALDDMLIAKNGLLCRVEADALAEVSTKKIKNSMPYMDSILQTSSKQGEVFTLVEGEGDGNTLNQALSGEFFFARMQSENKMKLQRLGKFNTSQIAPLFSGDTCVLAAEDQDSSSSFERGAMGDTDLRGKESLSCFVSNAVCGIASCLWNLVLIGSRHRSVDY